MKKPSVFSKDYEKKIKQIRRRKIIIGFLILLGLIGLAVFIIKPSKVKGDITSIKNIFSRSSKKDKKTIAGNKSNIDRSLQNKAEKEIKNIEKTEVPKKVIKDIDIKLNDQLTIRGKIEEFKGDKIFISMNPIENITCELSKDKKTYLIFNARNQDMYLANIDGKVTDITRRVHYTKNKSKIYKENKLKSYPNFMWATTPKLFNGKVFYLSKLPNLSNKHPYFVWVYDINSNKHEYLKDARLRGYEGSFGEIKENKLEIILNKNKYLVHENGNILK
ncbi:hypothetical protein ACOAKC_04765 [Hathewaya histolytica]|uniref:hypothetical protein n=1 Tax=Hathewaya histolytica TaxID=1498 RepID=UPI003B66C8D2